MQKQLVTPQWTLAQLETFSQADDLKISPFYSDGKTYGTPTWIWSVVVANQLYIRAWNGRRSHWYQSAAQQRAGRMLLAGSSYDIAFTEATNQALTNKIDLAYQQKYGDSPYLSHMIQAGAKASTLCVTPR